MDKKDTNIVENLTKQEALQGLFEKWDPQIRTEIIPVEEAYGRIAAEDQTVLYDLPVYRAASMDGIAVDSARFENGMPDTSGWKAGVEYIRADTGDDFDDAYDSVIKVEHVKQNEDGSITICLPDDMPFERGMNVRAAGAMMKKGNIIVEAGRRITALDQASLVSGGITELSVICKPKVGFIPTGSELVAPGEVPQRGQNIESNTALTSSLIREWGGEPVSYPITRDIKADLKNVLVKALDECDIVIINGGSSKGLEDFNTKIISELGDMICHWVKAAPGRPMALAVADNKPLINLSGPPIAAFHGLEWCLRPVIAKALSVPEIHRPVVQATLMEDISTPGFMEFLCLVKLTRSEDGSLCAHRANKALNSGIPALYGDGILYGRIGTNMYRAGDQIDVELLRPIEDIR